jgi:hypothetical protein
MCMMCVVWLCMGVPCKREYGERGGSSVVRALKLGSKWSQVGGGKKLHIHTHHARERGVKNFCLFVCLFAS